MRSWKFKVWRKVLPFIFVFVLVHFLKDITQDILQIATPLDWFGDIKEDLTALPKFIQQLFIALGYASFVAELFLLIAIPIVLRRNRITWLEKMIIAVMISLFLYFIFALLLDPRFKIS